MMMNFINYFKIFIQNIFRKFEYIKEAHVIFLNVPYHQKDDAKQLGARWNAGRKLWFITSDMNLEYFKLWLPDNMENLKAEYFYLAKTKTKCFRCNEYTDISAIVLPEGFESIDDYDDIKSESENIQIINFCTNDFPSILSYISYISPEALSEICKQVNNYALSYSQTVNSTYFMSSCKSCRIIQGDNFIIEKFNAPFCPINVNDFELISFKKILMPISVSAASWGMGYPPLERYLGDLTVDGTIYSRCRVLR